ncbi:MAG: MFS transporter [Verrucomicrobia bacterium]|nr:MFS transporter [Verrucomicrobiota bacterium]MBU4247760.1 MFS transporter [Verrucomicrobiota bacterium]MBU4290967.1 MFS transporter [Verrucomicrobiota bacterium]MBU4496879.1 MFS transporter [Verrucomicrobiota bacterium]
MTTQQGIKNRWLIAASAVGIHLSIGSVYAWSVFAKPIISQCGWGLKDVQITFSIAILFLGLSAAFLGRFIEKYGPRKSGSVASICFGLGIAGSGVAIYVKSLYLLYLCYGVLGGIGLGMGYIAPVSTLVKWFPDRRGLATGLAIMGFGFAALICSPIIQRLIVTVGLANTFYVLGFSYFTIMFLSSQYLAPPQAGWMPKGFNATTASANNKKIRDDLSQLMANDAVKTRRFYWLWGMLFINITCGIAIISVASPMAQEVVGMTPVQAAFMVSLIGLFNGAGRIVWAALSDYIGRPNTYTAFFVIQITAFFFLPKVTGLLLFQILIFIIMTCYGGGFASIPAYIGDLFGTRQLGAIHGYILTAWAAAGLAGPFFTAWVRETTGTYAGTLNIFVALFVVAFIISMLIRLDIRQLVVATASRAKGLREGPLQEMERRFTAKLDEIRNVSDFITEFARQAGLSPRNIHRVQLAAEEAVAHICNYVYLEEKSINTCSYAYDDTQHLTVRARNMPGAFEVQVSDHGPGFNPLSIAPPDKVAIEEAGDFQGLGMHLIKSIMDEVRYQRADGKNVLTMSANKKSEEIPAGTHTTRNPPV